MKTLLLNLPNALRIQRRFMCSYHAPGMLLPPQELIALGGILRDWKMDSSVLLDAIAENLSVNETVSRIVKLSPNIIITLCGFECFEEDMTVIAKIKRSVPDSKIILFGHYATHFCKEIIEECDIDYIILGEPDISFSDLYDAIQGERPLESVNGIAYKRNGEAITQKGSLRIERPAMLPRPAYELLDSRKYHEPFLPRPLGVIQSARGCPYSCNYCVRSFGRKLTYRTSEQILAEIIFLKHAHGIRSLRFIDDTFTAQPQRVIELCQKMIDLNLDIQWACLSRPDTLQENMLAYMKQAGCRRIYFGIESGSPKVLNYLHKEYDLNHALRNLNLCREAGIETLGFFIVGTPVEEDTDFEMSVNFAVKAQLDYVILSTLIPYPGTALYEQVKNDVHFSLLPYRNEWKDQSLSGKAMQREKEFYQRFYLRKSYAIQSAKRISKRPVEFAANSARMISFLLRDKREKARNNFI